MSVSDDLDILGWLDQEESVRPAVEVKAANTGLLTSQTIAGTCFEISRDVLLHILEKAVGVVPTRDMVPVLMNFQFRVEDGFLTVVASSLEMAIAVSTNQITTKVAGVEVFPARILLNIVKECSPGSTIYIEVTTQGAVIVSGGFSVEIALPSKAGYPTLDKIFDVQFYEVDRLKFINAVSIVRYALPSKDFSGQASLKFINIKGGKFTTCDGSRFQQSRIDGFKLNFQLPGDSIAQLLKLITPSDQPELSIGETKDRLVFKVDNIIFYLNKVDSVYPNVEQLWLRPALSNDKELIVTRQELITAIKQVKVLADSDSTAIGLQIADNQMTIVAKSIDNSGTSIIPCKWTGKPRSLVVNYIHLAEMLKAYSQPECRFLLGEDTKTAGAPLLLKDDDTMALATIPQLLTYRAGLTA